MKTYYRTARFGALLILLLVGGVTTATAGATLPLGNSSEIPAAQGKVSLHSTKNGNVKITLSVQHLAPPGRIIPGAEVFVVWARGLALGSEAQNLGALRVDKKLNGKLTAVTAMPSFDLFITCEQSQTATVPGSLELLPVHCASK
jgi:hypothetical protein